MKQIYLQPPNIIQPIFSGFFNVFERKPIKLKSKFERWRSVADLVKLSDKAKLKLEWIIFYYTVAKEDAYKTAQHFSIAPKTFYKWFNRFIESKENVYVLEEKSRTPNKVRQWEVTSIEEARIIKLRQKHLHWGKKKLKKRYQNEYQEKISTWKIERIIRANCERIKLYPDKVKAEKTALKIKRAKANPKKRITDLIVKEKLWFLVHLDTIVIYWGSLKRYILTAVDHTGKFGYARMYKTKSSRIAKDFLYRLHYVLDEKIINAQTDEGSEFKGEFDKALEELETTHWFSRPRTPKDNSPVERFNETLEYEWLNDGNFNPDTDEFNKNLTKWLEEYNFVRPHQTLDYLTPIEYIVKAQQQANILLPMWSARTSHTHYRMIVV